MTGPDVPHGDMPNFPWSGRRDVPALEDTALAALLGEGELPAGAATAARPLADLLAALTAAPAEDELAGEAAALAVFRRRDSVPAPAPPPRRRVFAPLLSLRVGLAAGAVAASLSGVAAAAAYTGSLPVALQRIAHVVIGAPAPGPGGAPTRSASPSPTSLAGARLCAAYRDAEANGTAAERAAAFSRLAAAAGGAAKVAAFCDAAGYPGVSPSPTPRPTGKPTHTHPSPHPTHTHPSPHPTPTHPTPPPHPTPSHSSRP